MSNLVPMFFEYIRISYHRISWILLFGIVFCAILLLLERGGVIKGGTKGKIGVLAKFALSVLFATFFVLMFLGRVRKDYGVQLVPFSSYYWAFTEQNTELFLQCIMNVLLHVALGFLLPCCYVYFRSAKRVLAATLIYSLCVEFLQGILQLGYFEVDDVINSVMGALLGMLICKLTVKAREHVVQ